MASVISTLSRLPAAQATLYDPGETNPRPVGLLISNIRGLGTERVVSDFSVGWLHPRATMVPGQTALWQGERFLVVKITKSAKPILGEAPQKVQLLHLAYSLPHFRAGMALANIRIVPEVSITLKSEVEVPLDRVHLIAPLGSDVRVNDSVVWDGWVWYVRDVLPGVFDGHEYARTLDVIRLGYATGPQDYLFTNASVLRYRGDDTDPAPVSLRCRWFEPTHDRLTEDGQVIPTAVYFPMHTDIIASDILMQVSFDAPGDAVQPVDEDAYWVVTTASHEGTPLDVVRVELEGGNQFA